MKEVGLMTKQKDLVNIIMQMEHVMKVIGKTTSSMVLELNIGQVSNYDTDQ
jgi:hypothetical protein